MRFTVPAGWEWLVIAVALLGLILLVAADVGLAFLWSKVWSRRRGDGTRVPRFPWSDRTGT
jgi:hypothetical protein